ncbi:hypothetical protein PGB90_000646 [Kerria lacca]
MSFWRAVGLNYIQFSNIAAKMVRRSLKKEFQVEALKRDESSVKFTTWKEGKPEKISSKA